MKTFKKFLFGLILSIMIFSPLVKGFPDVFTFSITPLKGYIKLQNQPDFTWKIWFDATYQSKFNKYLEDHIGLRNVFVRFYNQIDFSLFRKGHAAGVVIGKEDYLYETNYIRAYTGQDFIGKDVVKEKCRKIKAVQEELEKLDTELLIVFAPGKASFFPEYIPDRYLNDSTGVTNNEAYLECFQESGIKHIDFNSLFINMRDTSRYALYPKCGIHWSIYGAWFAFDSIIHYIEKVKDIDMVDMSIQGIEISEDLKVTDYDIGNALNLMCQIPTSPMPYPYGLKFTEEGKGKVKPNLMVIADSYYWTLYNLHNSRLLWDEQDFRYYNQESFTPGQPKESPAELTLDELKKFDVIMILYTEANMFKFANDFFEDAYPTLLYAKRLEDFRQSILTSPEWLKQLKEKADKRGISLDKMITLDAQWMLDKELERENNKTNNE